jgi:hypothetical protein
VTARAKARAVWKRTRQAGVPAFVGNFYTEVATRLLPGAEADPTQSNGDLVAWLDNTRAVGVEVKGSDNSHQFRLPVDQLKLHRRRLCDSPFLSGFYYFLCCYSNTPLRADGTRQPRRLSRRVGEGRGREFLARQTQGLYILPIELVDQIERMTNRQIGLFPCEPEREALAVNRTDLKELVEDPTQWFARRGHANSVWTCRISTAHLNGSLPPMEFKVFEFGNGSAPLLFPSLEGAA